MKNLIFAGMLLFFVTPAFSELSDSDLQRIREIVQFAVTTEGKQIREEMTAAINASEKRIRTDIDVKISGVNNRIDESNKRQDMAFTVLGWLFALVIAAIGIPQLIMAFRQRGQEQMQTSIQELRAAYHEVLAELKLLKAENEARK